MGVTKKLWLRLIAGLLTATLIVSLVVTLLPKVTITSEGILSIDNRIAYAQEPKVYVSIKVGTEAK